MEARLSHAIDVCAAQLEATYLDPSPDTREAINAMVDALFDAMRLMQGGTVQDETGEEFVSYEESAMGDGTSRSQNVKRDRKPPMCRAPRRIWRRTAQRRKGRSCRDVCGNNGYV